MKSVTLLLLLALGLASAIPPTPNATPRTPAPPPPPKVVFKRSAPALRQRRDAPLLDYLTPPQHHHQHHYNPPAPVYHAPPTPVYHAPPPPPPAYAAPYQSHGHGGHGGHGHHYHPGPEIVHNPDHFSYRYHTHDGTAVEEHGKVDPHYGLTKSGSFKYISPEGIPIHLNYIADAYGFRASGHHLPTPPADPHHHHHHHHHH